MSKLSDLTVFKETKINPSVNSEQKVLSIDEIVPEIGEVSPIKDDTIQITENINDYYIAKSLEAFAFPHPQILISLLPDKENFDSYEIRRRLKTIFLAPVDEELLTPLQCIANSFGTTTQHLISTFKFDTKFGFYEQEWKKIYPKLKFSTTSPLSEDWALLTIDNLKQLHILACILDTRIYLLHTVYSEDDTEDPVVFSTFVGPEFPKSNCYLYCLTHNKFLLLSALSREKKYDIHHELSQNIQTIHLSDKRTAHYLSFSQLFKSISEVGTSFSKLNFS
ncbi:hypothetical protein TVAG_011070 [Trichomonas vaginalis G3]|uniref:Uncharacterized protein n=1 Tax=Trichomonas vaginalis (strain ATCC PRA-98 / G3) TaxID=412133 RepID=A2DP33_TRIV3|nr:hypothetical protein TVAGG3_0989220 [Trichomonas vaginalis G3]EAY17882.1 hypothetical protein TVAG_011070 [Trichomonas vaginalis G3]KAI5489900.1 hypothetical protein TVAGG3_0989220 [Trichomonas vaginalis G3]|eukprot:XP_001330017.1 hypothetical protein [Trichomonas vaginalis G3]